MRFKSFVIALVAVISITFGQQMLASDESYRPLFHFTPKKNWMNDPNGMVYLDGEYHLFYQYNPYGTTWGPMHWGHAVSKDLLNWEELPIALFPDNNGTIFSGSIVFDENNTSGLGQKNNPPLVAIYTYNHEFHEQPGAPKGQSQALAYSLDKGRTWQKYARNPVLKNEAERDFRDPKLMWYAPEKKWVMSLAVGRNISFYSSKNLLQWKFESSFGEGVGAKGGVWECPDLIPLQVSDNEKEKYLLLVSLNPGAINGGSGTQYFVGDFDGKDFILDPKFRAQLQQNISVNESPAEWMDYGADNYAGVSWSNLPTKRSLSISWMNNWNYGQVTPLESWRGAMTLPRVLSLHEKNDRYFLKSVPAHEVASLTQKSYVLEPGIIKGKRDFLEGQRGNSFPQYVQLQLNALDSTVFTIELGSEIETSQLTIDRKQMEVVFDRDKSGITDFSTKFIGRQRSPLRNDQELMKLEFYIDRSSIEIFINDGEIVFTNQIFPTKRLDRISIVVDKTIELTSGKFGYF